MISDGKFRKVERTGGSKERNEKPGSGTRQSKELRKKK